MKIFFIFAIDENVLKRFALDREYSETGNAYLTVVYPLSPIATDLFKVFRSLLMKYFYFIHFMLHICKVLLINFII